MNKIQLPEVVNPIVSEIVGVSELDPCGPQVKKIATTLRLKKRELLEQMRNEITPVKNNLDQIKSKYNKNITAIKTVMRAINSGIRRYLDDQRRIIISTVVELDLNAVPMKLSKIPTVEIPEVRNVIPDFKRKPRVPDKKTQQKPKSHIPIRKLKIVVVDIEKFAAFCIKKKLETGTSYFGFLKVDTRTMEETLGRFAIKPEIDGIKYEYYYE